jgi:hypothetical protein
MLNINLTHKSDNASARFGDLNTSSQFLKDILNILFIFLHCSPVFSVNLNSYINAIEIRVLNKKISMGFEIYFILYPGVVKVFKVREPDRQVHFLFGETVNEREIFWLKK